MTAPKALDAARHMGEIYKTAIDKFSASLDASFEKAVDMLMDAEGHVIICGMGKSGLLAVRLAQPWRQPERLQFSCILLKRSMVIWGKCVMAR